tara:strand:+ start:178 stop:687 length:510 start_codon:yes stop_codon:yes gene_type:complete
MQFIATAEEWHSEAGAFIKESSFDAAHRAIDKAITLGNRYELPNRWMYLHCKGCIFEQEDDRVRAVSFYEQSVRAAVDSFGRRDPVTEAVTHMLACLHFRFEEFSNALQLTQAEPGAPARNYCLRALCFGALNEPTLAGEAAAQTLHACTNSRQRATFRAQLGSLAHVV